MKFTNFLQSKFALTCIALLFTVSFSSCEDDEETTELESTTYTYSVHNGQTVAAAPYGGSHNTDFSASMKLDEKEDGNTTITVTLNNTVDGQTYNIHAHDAADPSTTPNGTPYNETPNGDVFAQTVVGNGGTVSVSQEATSSFTDLTTTYEAFFVVHDPLQPLSTTDISTYLVVGSFARTQPTATYQSTTFSYDFNTGQVAAAFAYSGTHATNLGATIQVDELADNKSRVTVRINNTLDGETYHTHAHDMADPTTTPNGTPYNETPNDGIFAAAIAGNGGTAASTNVSATSYSDITTTYDGFFVVHDPLETLSTTDPTTYVVLGVFAR